MPSFFSNYSIHKDYESLVQWKVHVVWRQTNLGSNAGSADYKLYDLKVNILILSESLFPHPRRGEIILLSQFFCEG